MPKLSRIVRIRITDRGRNGVSVFGIKPPASPTMLQLRNMYRTHESCGHPAPSVKLHNREAHIENFTEKGEALNQKKPLNNDAGWNEAIRAAR